MEMLKVSNGDWDADTAETQLLDLPNEILTNIMLKLAREDRIRMSKVNRRLNGVERRAGNRSFTLVRYDSKRGTIEASYNENQQCNIPLNYVHHLFFNQSTTYELKIEIFEGDNSKNEEVEKKLCSAFKTLVFQKLVVVLNSECSRRSLLELVRGRKDIDVKIVWMSRKDDSDSANKLFMDLPPMNKCKLISERVDMMLDEEALLHVVSNSNFTEVDCAITASGIVRAFEMVCGSQKKKVVKFCVSPTLMDELRLMLDESRFSVVNGVLATRLEHRDSGAFLRYFVGTAQRPGRSGFCSIMMGTRQ